LIKDWLEQDLNGDGIVTRAELERYFFRRAWTPNSSNTSKLIGYELKSDRNKDDVVEFDEALSYAKEIVAKRSPPASQSSPNIVLQLDENADGTVSFDEFDAAVGTAFARIDKDGDGKIAADEIAAYRKNMAKLRKAARAENRARRRAKDSRR
jgi:Ca2+-binding EF-hand superfamily protein